MGHFSTFVGHPDPLTWLNSDPIRIQNSGYPYSSSHSLLASVLHIRIRMDPHHFGKSHPDPHESETLDPDPRQKSCGGLYTLLIRCLDVQIETCRFCRLVVVADRVTLMRNRIRIRIKVVCPIWIRMEVKKEIAPLPVFVPCSVFLKFNPFFKLKHIRWAAMLDNDEVLHFSCFNL